MSEIAADADPLVALRDEMFRRLGRNVWLFQRVEAKAKFLVSFSDIEGPPTEIADRTKARVERVNRRTLGMLAGDLSNGLLSTHGPSEAIPDDWMQVSIRLRLAPEDTDRLRSHLTALVAERNDIVHDVLNRWDVQSEASMQGALTELDAQRERILVIDKTLLGVVNAMKAAHDAARIG